MKRFLCIYKIGGRFSVASSVLGESFSYASMSGLNVKVSFPVCGDSLDGKTFLVPQADWKIADKELDWGICDDNTRAVVKHLYFEFWGEVGDEYHMITEGRNFVEALFHNLRILSPYSFSAQTENGDAGQLSGIIWDDERGPRTTVGYLSFSKTKLETIPIEKKEVSFAISHLEDSTRLSWDLWLAAFENFLRGEYRASVVNSAMAIEKAMNDRIRDSLRLCNVIDSVIDEVLLQSNGHSGKEKLLKKLVNYSSKLDPRKKVFDLRNKVVHGGKLPTLEEAKQALLTSRAWLVEQNVSVFI